MKNFLVGLFLITVLANTGANAITLGGQYSVVSSATNVSGDTWRFNYQVTNINQSGPYAGLDGFAILAPTSAGIVSWTNPASYGGAPGFWNFIPNTDGALFLSTFPTLGMLPPNGYQWLRWWGNGIESVYPAGTTAEFSLVLDHVAPGKNSGAITTYWWLSTPNVPYDHVGANYTTYTTSMVSPVAVAVPEPGVMVLMLMGFALLCILSGRGKARRVL